MNFRTVKWLSSLIIITSSFFINAPLVAAIPKTIQSTSIQKKLAALEASSGGRIGVYAINAANDTHLLMEQRMILELFGLLNVLRL